MAGLSIKIKHIFISFAQNFFKDSSVVGKYSWDSDVLKTNVLIADKNAIDIGVSVKRPSIILSRGGFAWSGTYRNEGVITDSFSREQNVPYGSANWERNKAFTDLLSGSVTYNVIAKNGVEAEKIADMLYYALTGYRDLLKKKGIHKIQDLSMSDERIVKQSGDIDLTAVSISIRFLSQKTIFLGEKQNNVRVFVDDEEVFEGVHFRVKPDGATIEFRYAPEEDSVILVNYIDAITLNQINGAEVVEDVDGSRTEFTIENNGSVYGFYEIVDNIKITEADEGLWVEVDGTS